MNVHFYYFYMNNNGMVLVTRWGTYVYTGCLKNSFTMVFQMWRTFALEWPTNYPSFKVLNTGQFVRPLSVKVFVTLATQ
jgi:hypothetical protein